MLGETKRHKLAFKVFLFFTILYAFMIFYLSSISDLGVPRGWLVLLGDLARLLHHSGFLFLFTPFLPLLKQQDKVFHILLYFGFGFLLFLTLKSTYKSVIKVVIFAVFLGILYGLSDEFHQMFVAGRSASMMDLMADATGLIFAQAVILIFIFIFYLIKKFKRVIQYKGIFSSR